MPNSDWGSFEFGIGPAVMEDFCSGAWFIAILCFPGMREAAKRCALAESLMADSLSRTLRDNPGQHNSLFAAYPDLMEISESKRRQARRRMMTLLRYRTGAGRMAQGYLAEGLSGEKPELPDGMNRHSVAALAELVRDDVGISDSLNIRKQVWYPSLPVIHLAGATQATLRERQERGALKAIDSIRAQTLVDSGQADNLDSAQEYLEVDLQDADFVRQVVVSAMELEAIVKRDKRFGRHRQELVRVRWLA